MSISRNELRKAMVENDIEKVMGVLEDFELLKDGTPPRFMTCDRKLVGNILGLAAALAWHDKLDAEMAAELVERTAMTVDIFPLIEYVIVAAKIDTDNIGEAEYDKLPGRVQAALAKNKPSEKTDQAIAAMDVASFKVLLAYLADGEVERTHVQFNLPLIRCIRSHELVPDDLLFALMAGALREPIDGGGSGLGGLLGFISAMADDD